MNLLKLVITNSLSINKEFSFIEKRRLIKVKTLLNKARIGLLLALGIIMISLFIYLMWIDKNFHEACIPENIYISPKF